MPLRTGPARRLPGVTPERTYGHPPRTRETNRADHHYERLRIAHRETHVVDRPLALAIRTRVKLGWVERADRFLHSNAIRLVLFALVANTIMAQAFFNAPAGSSSSAAST